MTAVARAMGALFVAAATLPGCSTSAEPDGATPCTPGFLGDMAKGVDFEPLIVRADDSVVPCLEGDTVPMIAPPQGGRVLFVGVRATNVDSCGLQLTGALRDLTTQQVRLDSRTVNLAPTGDGWGTSGIAGGSASGVIASFANVPVCPNQWSATDIDGHVYGLEITIRDRGGRTLTKSLHVTPVCGEPANEAECRCICRGGYVLGEACSDAVDGGLDAGPGHGADEASAP